MLEQFLPDNLNFLNPTLMLTGADVIIALAISLALGLFIFFIYLNTYSGVMYSRAFAISLIAMNLITTLIVLAIAQHFIISIGMIGALSIIRFRTVIKEPLDLVYLFWSIAIGIIVGAGLVTIAVIGSATVGLVLVFFVYPKTTTKPYILVISLAYVDSENNTMSLIKEHTKKHVIKAKTVTKEGVELTLEVRIKNQETEFINEILKGNGVKSATLVSYNGDFYM